MILPNSLSPLPVSPSGDSPEDSAPFEDFVAARDVRKVILGTGDFPVEGLPAEDFDCFAGRADIPLPKRAAKWKPKPRAKEAGPVEIRVADMKLETPVVHPAFDVIPPARRAAPPQLRERADCEAAYGSKRPGRTSERWWVIGMGLAATALLFSGTLVDFIGREAMRRSRVEAVATPPASTHSAKVKSLAPAAAAAVQAAEEKEKALPWASKVEREED